MTSFFDKAKRQLLNKQLCVFLFLSFSTLFSATNAEDKDVSTLMSDDSQVCTSVNLPAEQDAVIHIYFGALRACLKIKLEKFVRSGSVKKTI